MRQYAVRILLLLCLVLPLAVAACVPRQQQPLSFDDQQALAAHRQCREDATQMNPEWRGNTGYAPWRAYYDMCMRRFEITDAQMRRLWLP